MLSPGAWIHGRHAFQSQVHAPSSSTRCCRVGRLTLPVVLFTAVRKENCLPLKMLLVKMWRRAWRRQRGSLQPPGPPAAAQSRGNHLLPAILPGPCSGFVSWELGGKLVWRWGVVTVILRCSVTCTEAFSQFRMVIRVTELRT